MSRIDLSGISSVGCFVRVIVTCDKCRDAALDLTTGADHMGVHKQLGLFVPAGDRLPEFDLRRHGWRTVDNRAICPRHAVVVEDLPTDEPPSRERRLR